jgi:very-short-patch-repair endonuclease
MTDFLHYNKKFKGRARDLRKQGVLSEVLLWNQLRARKLLGCQFLRQRPIDNYIVDFYCKELCLAIEVDGSSHDGKQEEDEFRQSQLESLGIVFLRFRDKEIKNNVESVVMKIKDTVRWLSDSLFEGGAESSRRGM